MLSRWVMNTIARITNCGPIRIMNERAALSLMHHWHNDETDKREQNHQNLEGEEKNHVASQLRKLSPQKPIKLKLQSNIMPPCRVFYCPVG